MASRNLDDLVPEVKQKAEKVLEVCDSVGMNLLIYCTLRTLEEQSRLYRQSRSWQEIKTKILKYKNRGFSYLANILDNVGPCSGPHVTNAGPGESWHNYAEAWDAVPLVGGKPAWKYSDATEEWDAYGECVVHVGMEWAGNWTSFKERPHAQLRKGSNPLKVFDPDRIHEILANNKLI
ncbi:M15 family metallopeptidase [bacterium]|nr:M15 family metallopeptidase [bacterium]